MLKENYHKWYSQWIDEDFEMLVFGEKGVPLVLFPHDNAPYFDYKDFGVIESMSSYIESGKLKVYCPDSRDYDHWLNYDVEPSERIQNYLKFDKLILNDIVKYAKYDSEKTKILFGGFGIGGYHAFNFAMKNPDLALGVIAMGAPMNIKRYVYGYYDDDCYFNNPADYVPGMKDPELIKKIDDLKIILCSGVNDNFDWENHVMSKQLFLKGINHLSDVRNGKINTYDDCQLLLNDNIPLLL